ncbi:hypothetical protein LZQ00_03825 [Sphingobacterium sp. SRCM116780]|uniref:hypothetical protein n=1 Tax=Sphingobacterium sp. SRCM116780 TaxID=2907623 RepID=UPI001F203ADF|nr:hypothetical protein [Sphingobacterium sp. SRCM116780]UIR56950.1 hypothetical protein LZQ00_03825 [Sphingobacterium sp. SRCM116780]
MKLSTKILIGLGIAMFVIPIVTTAYIVGNNSIDVKLYEETMRKEANNPNAKDTYLKTFKTKDFHQLQIKGNNQASIGLFIVKSDQYAVKIAKSNEKEVAIHVDENGQLRIELKEASQRYYNTIYIFTPDIKQIDLTQIAINSFSAKQDQLEITGNQLHELHFYPEMAINTLSLRMKNSHIEADDERNGNDLRPTQIKQLTLALDSSKVNFSKQNYESVSIQAKDSEVYFKSGNPDAIVKWLDVKTVGNTFIGLNDLQVQTLQGQLSDGTKTDLPAQILRKLLK